MVNKPFVSFCVKCHNQETLISEALDGAFSQTYPNMEIIISDDASTDKSVKTIEDKILQYRKAGGNKKVRFLQQKKNLGNAGNWQAICEVANGELFVNADGDDISLPNRTECIVSAWGGELIVYHDAVKIDMKGRNIGNVSRNVLDYCPMGAVASYSRRLFDAFGPTVIRDVKTADDVIYGGRMKILRGQKLWIDKKLVKYRVGSGISVGITGYRKSMANSMLYGRLSYKQLIADIDAVKIEIETNFKKQLREEFCATIRQSDVLFDLWGGKNFLTRYNAFRRINKSSMSVAHKLLNLLLLCGNASDPIFDGLNTIKYLKNLCMNFLSQGE